GVAGGRDDEHAPRRWVHQQGNASITPRKVVSFLLLRPHPSDRFEIMSERSGRTEPPRTLLPKLDSDHPAPGEEPNITRSRLHDSLELGTNFAASPYLVVVSGMSPALVFSLGENEVLGRGPTASIRIRESGVSRLHARIIRENHEEYTIEDLGSANGTFLNG